MITFKDGFLSMIFEMKISWQINDSLLLYYNVEENLGCWVRWVLG